KRLRPFLVVETAALLGAPREQALMAGVALECVHCYSPVHDDLPAMDNDELRRGQPTAHKAYDEATAILAGDGLLTFAVDMPARPSRSPTICSMSRATPRWSASRPARMRRPARPLSSASSVPLARARGCACWWPMRRRRSGRSAPQRRCS